MIKHSARHPRLRAPRGFALLVTIVLVAFLVLILVGLATFTRVETQVATNSQQLAAARQNALMALNIAVGQLQQAAGPDQRVTARADILDSNASTPVADGVNQPYWTGVWTTGNASLDIANSGTPQRQTSLGSTTPTIAQKVASATWLVSNPTPTSTLNPTSYTGTTSGVATNAIELSKNYGSSNATVIVPLVDIQAPNATIPGLGGTGNATFGRYAYWVSDEGVKAKVNITDPTLKRLSNGSTQVDATADLPKNLLHYVAPQAVAAHKILPSTLATDFRGNPNTDQILTPQQLPYLPSTAPTGFVTNRYAADVTTYGFGVLADVRNGGLKKDLTAAFEDNGNTAGKNYAKLTTDGTGRVYSARTTTDSDTVPQVGSTISTGLDGLRWLNLYFHYNLYKSSLPAVNLFGLSQNASGSNPVGVGNPSASSRPYTVGPRAIGWSNSNYNFGALSPIFLGYRWDVAVNSVETSVGSGQYNLQLHYYPQMVLYNPHSVKISSSLNNFRYGRSLASVSTAYLQVAVPDASSGTTNYYHTCLNLGGTLQRILYNTGFDDTQTFEPGETRVFGFHTVLQDNLKATPDATTDTNGAASEFKISTSPFGLISNGFSSNKRKFATLEAITALNANGTALLDSYGAIPPIQGNTTITLRLTGRPNTLNTNLSSNATATIGGAGSSDVSLPRAVMWPTDNGNTGSVMAGISGRPGSDGRRILQSGTPGTISTGTSGSVTRGDYTAVVSTMTGQVQVLSIFTRKKGIDQTGGTKFSNANIAIPNFAGNSLNFNIFGDINARYWDELYTENGNTWVAYPPPSSVQLQTDLTLTSNTTTSWGNNSTGAATPDGSRIVLSDIPVQPIVSIGQFMHMKPLYMSGTGAYTTLNFGTMFVGGSLPAPEVPLNQTVLEFGSGTSAAIVMDHSYLANQALFDRYFLSTVPPSGSGSNWPEQWTTFNTANSGSNLSDATKPLLNRRITPIFTNNLAPAMADLRDMDKAAANLLLNGAFNINSTSVDAWRTVLSSLSGNDLDIWNASTGSATTLSAATLQNPFVRFSSANSNGNVNDTWSGIRALSDTEITDLAEKIVSEIKTRGPFLSMGDFLNRRLGSTSSDLTRAGALQAAIDKTSLNDTVKSAGVTISVPTTGANLPAPLPIAANMKDASSSSGADWKTTIGAPGYLMQQDLVQALAPIMSARSDTFVVRTYGEAVNPVTGNSEGKAWLEAVVQRLPEYVDSSMPAETDLILAPASTAKTTNQSFGRRFKVVSFRWLNSNDI